MALMIIPPIIIDHRLSPGQRCYQFDHKLFCHPTFTKRLCRLHFISTNRYQTSPSLSFHPKGSTMMMATEEMDNHHHHPSPEGDQDVCRVCRCEALN